jgi:hypothetical protein
MPKDGAVKKEKRTKKEIKKSLQEKNRFMREALNARFPDAKSSAMIDYDFTAMFDEEKMKVVGGVADRVGGGFGLGRGKFDKPYQQLKKVVRGHSADLSEYLSGDKDLDATKVNEMITDFEQLANLTETWLNSDEVKWEKKGEEKKDPTTVIKEIEARGILEGARTTVFQLKNRDLLNSNDIQLQAKALEAAQQNLLSSAATDEHVDEFRQLDAEMLAKTAGMTKPKGGTSEARLIKAPDGSVAYAFKPMKGEASQMGTPEGAGAVREVLMSKICEAIKEKCNGFDLGWPQTSMAKMDIGNGKYENGALVEGLKGEVFATEAPKDTTDAAAYVQAKARANTEILPNLPAKEIQKIALCNLVMGNFDTKWDNVMIEEGPNGPTARPFDAGVAVPDLDTFMRICHVGTLGGSGSVGAGALNQPGKNFTYDLDGNPLKRAGDPIDPDLTAAFLKIDVGELEKVVKDEIGRLEKTYKVDCKALGLDKDTAFQVTAQCIRATQQLLQDKNMTLAKFVTDFQTTAINAIVKTHATTWTPQWQQQVSTEYKKLTAAYPTLLIDYDNEKDMYMNCTSAPQKAALAEIVKLLDPNDPNLRKTYPGLKLPTTDFRTALERIKAQMRQDPIKKALAGIRDQIANAPDKKTAGDLAKTYVRTQKLAFDADDLNAVVNAFRGI